MWTLCKTRDWNELRQFAWVNAMHGVPQSPVHHAEGDVAIHTQMVLEQLLQLTDYQQLPPQDQEILWAAALLHDVEKRSTTFTDEHGHIVSPGHAKKGALTTRQILYREIDTPFQIREQIVALVRYHGLPLWCFEKPDPQRALLKASLEVNLQWLYLLAKADVLGRICNDQAVLLYKLELFKEYCIEQKVWHNPYPFANTSAKFHYFQEGGESPDYIPFENPAVEVILLSGIAGSGKDFFIRKNYPGWPVVSLDAMRRELKINHRDSKGNGQIIQACKEQARSYLRQGTSFVWNATNITAQMREQLIDLLRVYKPSFKIIYVEVPYKTLILQNRSRPYPIPESAIEKMIDKLEVPRLWEAHQIEWRVK